MSSNIQLSILYPDRAVSWHELPESTCHDLGMDQIICKVANGPQEELLIHRIMNQLADDPEVSSFRCDVFEDILKYPDMRSEMMSLLEKIKGFYDYGVVNRGMGDEAGLWNLIHCLEEYRSYIITVETLQECLSRHPIRSAGLRNLLAVLNQIYHDNGFAALKADVEKMSITASELKSVTLGLNLNERFEAVSIGLVSVNRKPFTRSGILKNFIHAVSSKDEIQPDSEWNENYSYYPANSFPLLSGAEKFMNSAAILKSPAAAMSLSRIPDSDALSGVPYQVDSAATMLASKISKQLKEMLGKYIHISVKEISNLIPELLYYTRWAEYIERSRTQGWHFCKPDPVPSDVGVSCMNAVGFYNLKLLDSLVPQQTILNDLFFDRTNRVYILTGANRGGKTTFTQALGQLFLLAQGGIFVPADKFVFTPADLILTHFPADEDRTLDLGRLGEECKRFRDLYAVSSERSLFLLNETFSTTSFEEGYYIALDSVRAILNRGSRTVYNTHMHKLASDLESTINDPSSNGKAVSLVAESSNEKNTFVVKIAPPEGKSYARNIAEKYGVTYELLTSSKS